MATVGQIERLGYPCTFQIDGFYPGFLFVAEEGQKTLDVGARKIWKELSFKVAPEGRWPWSKKVQLIVRNLITGTVDLYFVPVISLPGSEPAALDRGFDRDGVRFYLVEYYDNATTESIFLPRVQIFRPWPLNATLLMVQWYSDLKKFEARLGVRIPYDEIRIVEETITE